MIITLAAEGDVDITAATRLCEHAGHSVDRTFPQKGKSRLDRQLPAFNNAARFSPWLVLRDLDHDANCAPTLRVLLLPAPSAFMLLRIAVRAVEAWLLADRTSFATFFKVQEGHVPLNPDNLINPKQTVLDLVARSSSKAIRTAMLPNGSWRAIGRGYPGHLMHYIQTSWNIAAAKEVSPSLQRCVAALIALPS